MPLSVGQEFRSNTTRNPVDEKKYDLRSTMFSFVVKTPTPTQHNTTVGFDMKMTVQTTPPHTNFSGPYRRARELKFGTDTH